MKRVDQTQPGPGRMPQSSSGEALTEAIAGELLTSDVGVNAQKEAGPIRRAVERAAYYRAERRGFEPGHELEDWLAAEEEVAAGDGAGTIG